MNKYDYQKAIEFFLKELEYLKLAPRVNGCEMTKEWQEQIDIYEAAIDACRKVNMVCTDA